MSILLVINIIGLFITLVNVLLFTNSRSYYGIAIKKERAIPKERANNLEHLDSINQKLNNLVHTVDRNNLKYEGQFNDIWHRIARKDEPLDPDEVNDQIHQYFNMLDNIHMPGGTIECAKQCTTDQFATFVTDTTDQTAKATIDETNQTITSEEDNSVKEEEHE